MSAPFVSVITPVHNDAAYLEQCIRSVVSQTHDHFEYLICDNHSRDQSGDIARDYASRDARIRVISPPSLLPQYKNFNFALQQIADRAAYVKMVFADDWIYPESLASLTRVSEAHPTVGLASCYRLIEATPDGFGLDPLRSFFTGREAARAHLLGTAYAFGNPSQVLYRADVVRSRAPFFFNDRLLNADMDTAFHILEHHDFGFVHQVLAFSRYQQGSITSGIESFNNWFISRYMEVLDYGRIFLGPLEYDQLLEQVSRQFHTGLGVEWWKERLRPRRELFWKFQNDQLASTDRVLDKRLLSRGIRDALVQILGHPAQFFSKGGPAR